MKGFEVVTGMKIAEWAADLAANREVLRQGQEGSMTFTLSGRVRAVQKRGVWEADTWSKTIKLVGDWWTGGWLWGGVVLPEPSIFILSWVSQCLVHTQLSQHLGSDFACQSWEERMVTLRSHDTWGIGHWLGEGEPFWFQDSSCLGISGTATGSSQGYSRAIFPAEANGSSTRSCEAGGSSNSCWFNSYMNLSRQPFLLISWLRWNTCLSNQAIGRRVGRVWEKHLAHLVTDTHRRGMGTMHCWVT